MRDLNYQLKGICARNKDGSFATQAARLRNLDLAANQLHELGYRNLKATGLKPKHVSALIAHWQSQNLSASTIKNRMASLRWWAEKIGKTDMIAPNNDAFNIARRRFVTNESKAISLSQQTLDKVTDEHLKTSLRLQEIFGLRREESLKFQPSFADEGDRVRLKSSWTKGGQERVIPITNDQQRQVLDIAHKLAGRGSMIPPGRSYRQQVKRYEQACREAGISKAHGLRHAYAQRRYRELTGWDAPATGGPTSEQLSSQQKIKDQEARLVISEELGHHREAITAVYLGR